MTKEDVFGTLKKNIMEQLEDEVDVNDISENKSIIDLGANSLDIVEIISNTMRELEIKVPREDLAKAGNIGSLVEIMAKYKNEN